MYPSEDAHQLSILLRISRELDIVGDVTATVDSPSELIAWALFLHDPVVCAWIGTSGKRYVQATAPYDREPVRGRVTAVLSCDHHPEFWSALPETDQLTAGEERLLTVANLSTAWEVMPMSPED
jgi:hypothetical protein